MGLLDFLHSEKQSETFNLNEQLDEMISQGARRETAPSHPTLSRINPALLEQLYHQDEIVFNGVNVLSSVFLSADYDIISESSKCRIYIREFLRKCDFPYILQRIVQDMCIYGNAWMEKITNSDDKLVSLAMLDPKCFDVRRDMRQWPVCDKYGFPVSYVQYMDSMTAPPAGAKLIQQYDPWGNYSKTIEIPTNNLVHFTLYTVGNDPLGIGIVEPQYNVTRSKQTIRQGITQSTQRMGFPLIGMKVGDKDHHPTPQQLQSLYEKTRDINERTSFVHAYFIEPYVLESKNATQMQAHLEHYENAQIAAMGIPKSIVTGAGEETNRSTLERQIYIWEKRSRLIQHRISHTLESDVLKQLASQVEASQPKFVFSEISTESLFGKVERWTELTKAGLLQPDAPLHKYIREMEQLPIPSSGNENITPEND